jgi:hypothetical protein
MNRVMHHAAAFGFFVTMLAGGCTISDGDDGEDVDGDGAGDGGGDGDGDGDGDGAGGAEAEGAGATDGSGGSAATSGGGSRSVGLDAGIGEDPAPEATEPGESQTCDAGGPDSDLGVFVYTDVTESTINLRGTVSGAAGDGVYYVVEGAQSIGGPVATDSTTGAFDITLPLFCGEQLIKLAWKTEGCQLRVVTRVARVDCTDEEIRVTLTWDGLGDDFELHLIKQDGQINDNDTDCTWSSCVGTGPDWGVAGVATDNPLKDVDDLDTYGPENIYYANPETGIYTVMVEHWGPGSAEADGNVIINVGGQVHSNAIQNLPPQRVWTVGTIEWPSGVVTLGQGVFDCSANWSEGCRAELP